MLSSQSDLQFRYRMNGFDQDWTRTGAEHRSATYTNLPAGSYTFVVEPWEMDHPEHVVRASTVVIKRPYFYRTPWFVAFCFVIVGLLAYAAYHIRMRQIRGRFSAVLAERSRLAREMHDTLIRGCAGVSAMLQAVRSGEAGDQESSMHMVENANTQILAMMDEARQSIWDLRRGELTLIDLISCIRQMADRLGSEYSVSLTCSASGEPFPLGQEQSHEVLMVAREAFINAIVHGRPTAIRTEMRFSAESLEMLIEDDGQGFNPVADPLDSGHYGLQGMRERIHKLGGTLAIESEPYRGTRICATIPRGVLHSADSAALPAL